MQYYQMTGFMGDSTPDDPNARIRLPAPKDAVLLLDFDGTLVDIAQRPMDVAVSDRAKAVLTRAMDKLDGRVALVSGRTIDDLEHFLPDFEGAMIGAHGAEARLDGKRAPTAEFDEAVISRVRRLVEDFAALRPEFHVEAKPTGTVLHYRQAEAQAALAMNFMGSVADAADGMKLQPALMAYEIKPESVGKDVALDSLLARPEMSGKTPIYAGDDLTDEPPLALVQDRGGVAIKIGQADTVARHRLADPEALIAGLEAWLA